VGKCLVVVFVDFDEFCVGSSREKMALARNLLGDLGKAGYWRSKK